MFTLKIILNHNKTNLSLLIIFFASQKKREKLQNIIVKLYTNINRLFKDHDKRKITNSTKVHMY